jgi:hypothetical protein
MFFVFCTQFLSEISKIVSILRKLSVEYDLIKKNKDFDTNLTLNYIYETYFLDFFSIEY